MDRLLLLILIYSLNHLVLATINSNEKCEYKDTVDLTNLTRLENGSYVYGNILIPEAKLAYYDYRLEFRNKRMQSEKHLRGCICDEAKRIYCLKLCCDRGQYYNEEESRCEPMPIDRQEPTEIQIKLINGKRPITVDTFKHFVQQVGLPCETPEVRSVDESWDLLENGLLLIDSDDTVLDSVSYCFTPHRYNDSDEDMLMPMSCPTPNDPSLTLTVNSYAMVTSVVFLIITILVYLLIKELRNNFAGQLMISYLFAMATAYVILSYINISQDIHSELPCSILGFTAYFFFMSAFLWLSVLCFDIWNSFNITNANTQSQNCGIRFAIYSLYAWGSATVLTAITLWAQLSDRVPELYKPGIGIEICWLNTSKWAAALYFYLPNFIIVTFNITMFAHMTRKIYQVRCEVARMTNRESFLQENAAIIMRLFLIMGVSWIMDIISYCLRDFRKLEYFFSFTDFCNAIQGFLIFILFILRATVIALIKARFQPPKQTRPRLNLTTRETMFSRLTSSTGTLAGSSTIAMSP